MEALNANADRKRRAVVESANEKLENDAQAAELELAQLSTKLASLQEPHKAADELTKKVDSLKVELYHIFLTKIETKIISKNFSK